MKKRIAALCVCLISLACLSLVWAGAVDRVTVYFMVINEKVLDLRGDTMPFMSGGEVYVPSTMFDPNTTGINLGVYTLYGNNTAMVYSWTGGTLVFDLAADTAVSSEGETLPRTAIRRNSVVFLPVDLVCSYFSLDWSLLADPDYGFIVRVKNGASQLSDQDFVPASRYVMTPRYNAYVRSLTGEPAAPEPSVSSTPPTTRPSPSPSPSPSVSASPSPTPSQAPQGGTLYLAFSCGAGGNTAEIAAALVQQDAFGLFFFRPSELVARDDEVRGLAAAGHKLGLLLDGADEEERAEQARYGNQLLSHIVRSGTGIALTSEDGAPPVGWFRWTTDVDGRALERTGNRQFQQVLRQAVGPSQCFVLLDDSAQTAELLPRLLRSLAEEGCEFRLALETVLPQQFGASPEERDETVPTALMPDLM